MDIRPAWEGIDEFVAVAECGSFSAASTRLGVSSSHVSRQIARLEARLNTRLFYRTTRNVRLTEAGTIFLRRCQRLIDDRTEAFQALSELQNEPSGLLRMTSAVAYGERFIVPLVNRFMQRYPRLSVEIELTNRTLDLVHEGMDLAIRLGRLHDSSLVATRLAPRSEYLCATPDYLDRHGTPQSLAELERHSCLIGSADTWLFLVDGQDWSFHPKGRWRCNSGPALLDALLHGFGIAQLPDYYVYRHLRDGTLVALLDQHRPPNSAVWAVYPQRRYLSPKVRLLVAYLRDQLALLPEYLDSL